MTGARRMQSWTIRALMAAGLAVSGSIAGGSGLAVNVLAANCAGSSTGYLPIPDLLSGTYLSQQGGLYPGGTNTPPAPYAAAGMRAAQAIVPRDAEGRPDANGKIVLLSVGMSNTLIEFAAFMNGVRDGATTDPHLVLVNGSQGGQDAARWVDANAPPWSHVQSQLDGSGVSAEEVQVIWLKQAQAGPTSDFDSYRQSLADQMAAIVANAAARFPNLEQVFVSPRTYAGYATTRLNPEPYAYQTGFADQLLVARSVVDPDSRPWIGWGPYLWTDGTKGRNDGFTWTCGDARPQDGTHPSPSGAAKIAQLLEQFFTTSQFTPWVRQADLTATSQPATLPLRSPPAPSDWRLLGLLGFGALVVAAVVVAVLAVLKNHQGARTRGPNPSRSATLDSEASWELTGN